MPAQETVGSLGKWARGPGVPPAAGDCVLHVSMSRKGRGQRAGSDVRQAEEEDSNHVPGVLASLGTVTE